MKTINKPQKEDNILAAVKKNAKRSQIERDIKIRDAACVNHLCGCK